MKRDNYYQHTQYRDYVDLKKLDFIIRNVKKIIRNDRNNQGKVMDIGCGSGNIAIPLASLSYKVLAIDCECKSIEYVKEQAIQKGLLEKMRFMVGDVQKLDMKDSFDAIICSEVLEHLQDPSTVLARMKKVLKKNGVLLLTTPNGFGPYEMRKVVIPKMKKISVQLRKILKGLLKAAGLFNLIKKLKGSIVITENVISNPFTPECSTFNFNSPHVQRFTIRGLKIMLRENGFHILKIRNSDFLAVGNLRHKRWVSRLDCKLADLLPHFLVSGWYLVCRRK